MQQRAQKLTTKFKLYLSFRLAEKKRNIEILVQKPSLNESSISGAQKCLRKRWPKK